MLSTSSYSSSIVDRCFLINLDRRPDRLKQWFEQLPVDWPFPQPERVAAIDGGRLATPQQWNCGPGAWGCFRTHLQILEKCLQENISSYVVFEDDAGFSEDFTSRLKDFADQLPADWGVAYLGGQHLYPRRFPPVQISSNCYRPYNVNRTHAFMVRGRNNMKALYRHLASDDWHRNHHIDHHLGRLIQQSYEDRTNGNPPRRGTIDVYTPDRWIVGQLPSMSNICGRAWEETRFFNDAEDTKVYNSPFFAVMGAHRSGTSCVAMMMHHLGVHMGNELVGHEETGGGEAIGLAECCEQAMPFPAIDPIIGDEELTQQLRTWINDRREEAGKRDTVAGGKYPHLCRFAKHLLEAVGKNLRIISVQRDIDASIRSLQARSRKFPDMWFSASNEQCEQLQHHLLQHRRQFLLDHPQVPVLEIDFEQLLADPQAAVLQLIEFLGIQPSSSALDQAIAHVQPQLRKH